jgi:hypothetical protein
MPTTTTPSVCQVSINYVGQLQRSVGQQLGLPGGKVISANVILNNNLKKVKRKRGGNTKEKARK